MDKYEEALAYIHSLARYSGKPGLHRIRKLLEAIGNPQNGLKFVHIAGTNGKGSTSAMTAEVLKQAGYKTGLFISPYLVDFRERIQINGEMISRQQLTNLVNEVSSVAKHLTFTDGETIGEFEFITAVALKYFSALRCDLVVFEVGMGGKFDATNIIETPEVCAITSVSLDHMAILGDTIEQIAEEKSGIIKEGCPVISYPYQKDDALQIIRKNCELRRAKLIVPEFNKLKISSSTIFGSHFYYKDLLLQLPLTGEHQIYNCLVVLEILNVLRQKNWQISDVAIQKGIEAVYFPGRLEVIDHHPLVILDGAHNEDGVAALCRAVDTFLTNRRIYMILGMVSDKAYQTCIQQLASRAYMVFAVEPNTPRALSRSITAQCAQPYCAAVSVAENLNGAVCKAIRLASKNDALLICGSLYLIGDAKKTFSARHELS